MVVEVEQLLQAHLEVVQERYLRLKTQEYLLLATVAGQSVKKDGIKNVKEENELVLKDLGYL